MLNRFWPFLAGPGSFRQGSQRNSHQKQAPCLSSPRHFSAPKRAPINVPLCPRHAAFTHDKIRTASHPHGLFDHAARASRLGLGLTDFPGPKSIPKCLVPAPFRHLDGVLRAQIGHLGLELGARTSIYDPSPAQTVTDGKRTSTYDPYTHKHDFRANVGLRGLRRG